jgi:hypothetical protein
MNEVRVLYVLRRAWSFPILSGVGLAVQDSLHVPPGSDQRYDDPNHDPSSDIAILFIRWHAYTLIPNEIITWGALFHDSCWKVLVEASQPNVVNIDILHRFFLSFPNQDGLVNWGHNYGGYNYETYCANTFNSPELGDLLFISIRKKGDSKHLEQASMAPTYMSLPEYDSGGDTFFKIPPEVRESISILLPSKDVESLRVASRAFAELVLSQNFWASRFWPGSEMDYIFEARKSLTVEEYRSWKDLFFGLNSLSKHPAIKNRKRVWGILKPVTDLLSTYSGVQCDGKPLATSWEPHLEQRELQWQCLKPTVQGDQGGMMLSAECRLLFARQVCLDYITGVYVSRISYLDKLYISGLRFLQPDGPDVRLGYILRGREEPLDIIGRDEVSDGLGGFILAIGAQGINAISFVSGAGRVSDWVGDLKDCRRRSILARNGSIYNLRAEFDVSRRYHVAFPRS